MGSLRVVGYVRCSTHEQSSDELSLEAQAGRIEAWAAVHDAEIVRTIDDPATSGTRPLASRPGGSEISKLLHQRKSHVDAVAVVRLDRLRRDAAECLDLLKRFSQGRIGLVSITERLDLTSATGRAMAG